MDNFDDENYEDGFDEDALGSHMRMHLWKRLFSFAQVYKTELWVLGACAFVTAIMEVMYPLITKWVVDDVAANGMDADLVLWATLYVLVTLIIAASIGGFVCVAGKIRCFASHDIRSAAFENLQKLSFAFYDYRPVGWLMARMTSDCERLSNILAWGFLDLIWGSTMMLGIALAMLVMNWKLALLVLAILPFLYWVSLKFRRKILKSAREVRRTNSRITGAYNEAIMGVLTSKAFVREDANLSEFRGLTGMMFRASVTNLTLAAIYLPVVITLASLAMGLTLAVGGMDLFYGLIPVGTLVAFMAYARHFFDPVETMGHWFAEMQMAQASAERILSLIDADPEIKDSETVIRAMDMQAGAPTRDNVAADGGAVKIGSIKLVNVGFAYDPAQPVLTGINLEVHAGESIAIVGPTGGGKSTLVNLICRFYEPTSGQVLIDGVDYRNRSLHWLQSNLGMVLQNAHVFSGPILENIRYGRLDASDDEVIEAAKLAGVHGFIEEMEDGYQTDVGEGGSRLSAGQKQLVSFARAILADPQILVMDEATSSVDTETEQRIQTGLAHVLQGRISFIIAHRLSTIRNADRIIVVTDGRISETGDHASLIAMHGHYAALYRQQSLQETTRGWMPGAPEPQPG
ncbi:MAG: ABC transporter ATP-binding protein [Gammaproteobacteria bacterium]|nr:ABC transporter ATP-binding protein [Gammaproteobacteria bacterium]